MNITTNMNDILQAQKHDFLKNGELSLSRRTEILKKLVALLVDNKKNICAALSDDFSCRPWQFSMLADIGAAIGSLKHSIKHLHSWAKPITKPTSPKILGFIGAKAKIKFQAKGSIGIISPWNFPINLSFGPLASIIAAGNRAILKPSEFTPKTSQLIFELISNHFPQTEIAVILGGNEIGEEFSKLPFDHLIFTGATSIGSKIMEQAAKNLVPVTLELGGKIPVILSKDFDQDLALKRILAGKFMNAGQVCLAPDYLLIEESQLTSTIEKTKSIFSQMYQDALNNAEYCGIINDRHFSRLDSYINELSEKDTQIIDLNENFKNNNPKNSRKFPPLLVINPPSNSKIMIDEIFGPILPIITYKSLEEALEFVNSRPRPLALYYFGNDIKKQEYVINKTISGGVTINDVILHIAMEELPFGGIGASGMGAYHGHRGFLEFSHQRAIYSQTKADNFLLKATRPPYNNILEKYLNFIIQK